MVLTSFLSGIYLESWFSWSREGVQRTLKKRRNQREEKYWKYATIFIFGIKLYFAGKTLFEKKVVYTIKFCLLFSWVARYLKHSDNTPKLNISYINIQIIIIEIYRLSTTTQIFIAMDYLIMVSEKYLYVRKRKDHLTSNWIHVLWKYFSNYVFL